MACIPLERFTWRGLIELAAEKGLKTVALLNTDDLGGRAVEQGTRELARRKGLQVVFAGTYPLGTTDFSALLTKIRAKDPDALVGSRFAPDAVAIISQLKASNVNPRMFGVDGGAASDVIRQNLGRDAEFVYGTVPWLPELIEVRAGGLIPVGRQYPGAREFVEAYRKEFPGAGPAGSRPTASRGFGAPTAPSSASCPSRASGGASCPGCGGRRMAERAAYLVDEVLPRVPVRQWVLTLPYRLRYRLAWDHALCRAVLGAV